MFQKIHIITLGCPKNIADSEIIANQMKLNNILLVSKPEESDSVLINTCGFIQDAKIESIDTIFRMLELKKRGIIKNVYVMGCLYERYKKELGKEIKEVNRFFGVKDIDNIFKEIGGQVFYNKLYQHNLITPNHFAYLKISDGCNHACSFCAIPHIKGKYQSKRIELILKEAKGLIDKGVKEIILIAQDTTYYGKDLYGRRALGNLLKKISLINGLEWIRLMYAFPSKFPLEILDIILENDVFCKYIDLPVQHISDRVLKSMRRGITRKGTEKIIEIIRKKNPDIAIRTSLIVGYPDEKESDFKELVRFVENTRFERLGVFIYSKEEGTYSAKFKDRISKKEKIYRKESIMEVQRNISFNNNKRLMGKKLKVLIDYEDDKYSYGRTEWDAPEIDNLVRIDRINLSKVKKLTGKFVLGTVRDYSDYDLQVKFEKLVEKN